MAATLISSLPICVRVFPRVLRPNLRSRPFPRYPDLAEDRILCFELVAKKNCNWVLRYVKGAIGETDVPDRLPEFISQRRRWLNGSFFAATYAIAHVGQILRSGHSATRKAVLFIETIYNVLNLVFAWFAIVSTIFEVHRCDTLLIKCRETSTFSMWFLPHLWRMRPLI